MQRTAIAHLQLIAARVRRVEQAQAHPATGHFDIRALRAVNQQRIANEATAPRFAVFRRTEIIQTFVLDDNREVIHAVVVRDRQGFADFIFHQPHAGQAVIDLLRRAVRGVGVIPQGCRALANRQNGRPVGAGRHHARRAANQRARDLQAADGHGDIFRGTVTVDELYVIAIPHAYGRPKVTSVNAPDRRTRPLGKGPVAALQRQEKRLAATGFNEWRNRQRLLLPGGAGCQRHRTRTKGDPRSLNKLTPTE